MSAQLDAIPAFVIRGMSTLPDRRDLDEVRYFTEADLRDAMALHWWLHGWNVRTEVKVPNCGRIDVLAEVGDVLAVIELKKQITTPSAARSAYQQAHAYSAYLTGGRNWQAHTFVTAGVVDPEILSVAERAYPSVWGGGFHQVAALSLSSEVAGDCLSQIAATARRRSEQLASLADLSRGAAVRATAYADVAALVAS